LEAHLTALIVGSHGLFAYAAIFSVLVVCGLGLPLPEDISLILGGFLVHRHAAHLGLMMAAGFAGILCGDSIIFWAGRKVGRVAVHGGWLGRLVTPEKRAKVEGLFEGHGEKIVAAARFLPGVRAVAFFSAGSADLPFWRFLLFDGLAALGSAPLLVFLGFRFGGRLDVVIGKIKHGELALVGGILAFAIGSYLLKRVRSRKQSEPVGEVFPASIAPRSRAE
jgi:membrane protein DedA with SNARE-associated domain